MKFSNCRQERFLLELAKNFIPINERLFLEAYFGHSLFVSRVENDKLFFKMADPVAKLSLNISSLRTLSSIPAVVTLSSQEEISGFLHCGTGLVTLSPPVSNPLTSCYLPLVRLGGLDLCTGSLAPSVGELPSHLNNWIPEVKYPLFSISDPNYHEKLALQAAEGLSRSPTDVSNLQTALIHPAYYNSLSDYISVVDLIVHYGPFFLVLIPLWIAWRCHSTRTTRITSSLS